MHKDKKQFLALPIEDAGNLVLSRRQGESLFVNMNGEILEVYVAKISTNTVAIALRTAKKNLILRKELKKS